MTRSGVVSAGPPLDEESASKPAGLTQLGEVPTVPPALQQTAEDADDLDITLDEPDPGPDPESYSQQPAAQEQEQEEVITLL